MKKSVLLMTLLLSLFLSGCKETCYGVPEEIEDYFPYNMHDDLTFEDEQGDTMLFKVREIILPTTPTAIEWGCKCDCGDYNVYRLYMQFSQTALEEWSNVGNYLVFEFSFPYFKGGPMEPDKGYQDVVCIWKDHAVNSSLHGTYTPDTFLFTSSHIFIDSIMVVKDLGFTSFCTSDGHRYTNVSSLNKQNE
ncbi:MAG: hypothetical protein K5864_07865 [Bacteroidales bacterium]|nr:hypothetical protein [Bacteroidales bacterium]